MIMMMKKIFVAFIAENEGRVVRRPALVSFGQQGILLEKKQQVFGSISRDVPLSRKDENFIFCLNKNYSVKSNGLTYRILFIKVKHIRLA